jgi:hypothetical protein
MSASNRLRCKYCDWTTARWGKKGKPPGAGRLEEHVIAAHEPQFLAAMAATSLQEYLDRIEQEDEYLEELAP